MNAMTRRRRAILASLCCGAALAAAGAAVRIDAAAAPARFVVQGEVEGIYPGIETTLNATATNPGTSDLTVISVDVTAGDAGPSCPADLLYFRDLYFGDGAPSVVVPAGGQAVVPLTIRLDAAAPDACQGATWPLEFAALGTSDAGDRPVALDPGSQTLPATGAPVGALFVAAAALVLVGAVSLGGGSLADAPGRTRRRRST